MASQHYHVVFDDDYTEEQRAFPYKAHAEEYAQECFESGEGVALSRRPQIVACRKACKVEED
jgi:hypothetical protein